MNTDVRSEVSGYILTHPSGLVALVRRTSDAAGAPVWALDSDARVLATYDLALIDDAKAAAVSYLNAMTKARAARADADALFQAALKPLCDEHGAPRHFDTVTKERKV